MWFNRLHKTHSILQDVEMKNSQSKFEKFMQSKANFISHFLVVVIMQVSNTNFRLFNENKIQLNLLAVVTSTL